jgi:hypothetical protein
MIKSVVREHHWSPAIVGDFYMEEESYHGLEFWYNDVKEVHDSLKKK